MALFRREKRSVDRITSENLADFGRYEFLKEQSGVDPSAAYNLISPLNELLFTHDPSDRAALIAELHRHAAQGEWEKVGAWKYTREFLDPETPETLEIIDEGLRAIERMRVTNLSIHLSMLDAGRWREVFGSEPPSDGFFGPPVFDSPYGPSKQYYFDHATNTAISRSIQRIPSRPGVDPGELTSVAACMWDFGMLIHRGPLVVPPDISFEPNVVRPAVEQATNVDHVEFIERLAEAVSRKNQDDSKYMGSNFPGWRALGAARFAEDYLDPATLETPGYNFLLEVGLEQSFNRGDLGTSFPIEVLTPRQFAKLEELKDTRG